MALENGFSYGSSDEAAFALNAPANGTVKEAQIKGYQIVLRSAMSYNVLSRASSAGARAFESATKLVVANMIRSFGKRAEVQMLYGQRGLGVVGSVDALTIKLTISTADWAAGIWSGMKGAEIEVRSSAGALRGVATIAAVDLNGRALVLNAIPAGTVATDVLWYKGAYGNEMVGLDKIISNTGVLFNIDAAQYELWKGNTYDVGSAQLSFAKIQDAISLGVEKGLDSDVKVMVNPKTWANLLTEQAALRMYDSTYKASEAENGSQSIKFHGQNGIIEIVPSIYIKEGVAYIVDDMDFLKVGSTDMTFNLPGAGPDQFLRQLENNAGVEMRLYSDFSLFCAAPGRQIKLTGIVNA